MLEFKLNFHVPFSSTLLFYCILYCLQMIFINFLFERVNAEKYSFNILHVVRFTVYHVDFFKFLLPAERNVSCKIRTFCGLRQI